MLENINLTMLTNGTCSLTLFDLTFFLLLRSLYRIFICTLFLLILSIWILLRLRMLQRSLLRLPSRTLITSLLLAYWHSRRRICLHLFHQLLLSLRNGNSLISVDSGLAWCRADIVRFVNALLSKRYVINLCLILFSLLLLILSHSNLITSHLIFWRNHLRRILLSIVALYGLLLRTNSLRILNLWLQHIQ